MKRIMKVQIDVTAEEEVDNETKMLIGCIVKRALKIVETVDINVNAHPEKAPPKVTVKVWDAIDYPFLKPLR